MIVQLGKDTMGRSALESMKNTEEKSWLEKVSRMKDKNQDKKAPRGTVLTDTMDCWVIFDQGKIQDKKALRGTVLKGTMDCWEFFDQRCHNCFGRVTQGTLEWDCYYSCIRFVM